MTSLDSKGGLAIAEIVFYGPALLVSLFIVIRHGFARQMGWIYLVLLSLLRLIGSSALLYSESQQDYSVALLTTIYITSAIGTAPLLLALLGFLARVHDGMKRTGAGLPDLVFRAISLASVAALVIAIVGGTDITNPSNNASDMSTGHALTKAASLIFLVIYLVLAAIAILTLIRKASVLTGERRLVDAAVASLPFILVRIIYTVAVSFSTTPGSVFYFRAVNIYISAFMQFLMEAIVVVMFIVAGLLTPKREKNVVPDVEMRSADPTYDRLPIGSPSHGGQGKRMSNRSQRSLGDYRPSRLIRDAISGRR